MYFIIIIIIIGPDCEKELFVKQKVNEWIQHLETLSNVADDQPQAPLLCFYYVFSGQMDFPSTSFKL